MSVNNSQTHATPFQIFCWCLFDWGHSAFPIIMTTFIFSNYFIRSVAHSITFGTVCWAWTIALAGVLIAILSPLVGAIGDFAGRSKPWLFAMTTLCVSASALLWFTQPNSGWLIWAIVFIVIANIGYELAQIFYNTIMVHIAPQHKLGRISGWGWGLGYVGGLICLGVALICVHLLPDHNLINVRSTSLLTAIWFALFAVPLFIFTPDRVTIKLPIRQACRRGLTELWQTLLTARQHKGLILFLIAHLLYIDGLNTLFTVGGTFAGGTFHMSFSKILIFAITLNASAGIGAALFAWVDDLLGAKLTITISLIGLIITGTGMLLTHSLAWFWSFGLILGLFVGPTQAASRSYMARIAPAELLTQMFGLYNFSGRISSFIGPFLFGLLTELFQSQRAGMTSILIMIIPGLLLLLFVPNVKHRRQPIQ